MNKISKLGKELLEIALRESHELTSVESRNEKFELSTILDESLKKQIFSKIPSTESVSFSYWNTLRGERYLEIHDGENFLEAFARAISKDNMTDPTHLICTNVEHDNSELMNVESLDYVIYYIQKPQREDIFKAARKL